MVVNYFIDNISSLKSILLTFSKSLSGDRYPIIPILCSNLVMIVEGTRKCSSSGMFSRSILQFTMGNRAVFKKVSNPSMLSSNSWFPSDCKL